MKTVCAYIRVSTDSQEEYSPDAQVRLLKEYAVNNGMILVDIYQDLGISGRKAEKRPQFQEMIATAKSKEHPYDAILVWKFSRFARNQEESIVYKSLLKKNKVEVISVSEPLPDGFVGDLVERIFEWMDEYYSIRLSGEVKRGMTQKALNGGYNNRPPIGYNKDKGSNTIPYPDPYYAEMVRLCFHMYAVEHKSMTAIAVHINELGYRTRGGYKWEHRNILDIIQNPFYIGKIRWNNAKTRSVRPYSGEEIVVDGSHESIIDEELFKLANDRYNTVTSKTNHEKRATTKKHWLSGMIKCPTCGASLSYQKGSEKSRVQPHFVCCKYSKGLCTTRNSIIASKAEEYVMNGLLDMVSNFDLQRHEPIPEYKTSNESIEKAVEAVRAKLRRVKDAYVAGIDTLEEYKANKTALEAEISKLEASMADNIIPLKPITKDDIKHVHDFIEASDDYKDKAEAINSIIDHFVYDKATDSMKFFLKNSKI